VSNAAYHAALRARPGKVLVHLNGRHRMSCEKAEDPPPPLGIGRTSGGCGRLKPPADARRLSPAARTRAMASTRRIVQQVRSCRLA
jgi:hypothetical protein